MTDPFYFGKQWRAVRAQQLRRAPWCETCNVLGMRRRASQVDHRLAISQGGAPLAFANLRSLCSTCHSKKTARSAEHGSFVGTGGETFIDALGFRRPIAPVDNSTDESDH